MIDNSPTQPGADLDILVIGSTIINFKFVGDILIEFKLIT